MKANKEARLNIRVTRYEKKRIKEKAKARGFDKVSNFVLWLIRGA